MVGAKASLWSHWCQMRTYCSMALSKSLIGVNFRSDTGSCVIMDWLLSFFLGGDSLIKKHLDRKWFTTYRTSDSQLLLLPMKQRKQFSSHGTFS